MDYYTLMYGFVESLRRLTDKQIAQWNVKNNLKLSNIKKGYPRTPINITNHNLW